jgi:type III restriction enzyme
MTDEFFASPILNSPYAAPTRHWELDESGQPTQRKVAGRRKVSFVTPIPKSRKQTKAQTALVLDEGLGLSTADQQYDIRSLINELREQVDRWRSLKNPNDWRVTPETRRLLQHWRTHAFSGVRPFFCQVEAVETVIWLTEVAPEIGKEGRRCLDHLTAVNAEANPELLRLALKLATGAGKTTVMAMIIAWQTINAVRHPSSRRFTRGFLVVTPGITIRDRLQVLQPNDPNAYYAARELVPGDMVAELNKARIVISNYHAFKRRERLEISKGGAGAAAGSRPGIGNAGDRRADAPAGDAGADGDEEHPRPQRRSPPLLSREAGHRRRCHAQRRRAQGSRSQQGGCATLDFRPRAVSRKLGLARVLDLSATPFFLSGSGYAEGTLFPWTMSDFSLMDAIECGIVKLPRVPVADNIPEAEVPVFRELWSHIASRMPKKGAGKSGVLDPHLIPAELQTALEALYGHYARTFAQWEATPGVDVPPCFIVVCNNTATSKLVYEYISGFTRAQENGSTRTHNGRLPLFDNFNEHGNPYARPRTLLIDSAQLESGEALDDNFRKIAAAELEQFKRERRERSGVQESTDDIPDQDILREVMNTVGKKDRLGESIRCVVSVAMLTEGWDANTVTHVLGVRAFGTQLLCEQVIGRALRRQSYELNDKGLFDVEYADVLGIPFDFTAKPVPSKPQPVKPTVQVRAVSPERDGLEIRFPRLDGYIVRLPEERLVAEFTDDHTMHLTPASVGPTETRNEGIIGEGVDLSLVHSREFRQSSLIFHLTNRLLHTHWRDPNGQPKLHLFGQLKAIVRHWLDHHLVCSGGTYPAQLMYLQLADDACERITDGIVAKMGDARTVMPMFDPYNPVGSTRHVNFTTSKTLRWQTRADRCHLNWVICDSNWEAEFCRVVEKHPRVRAYLKNHNLGFEVPYRSGAESRRYRPDFIVLVDDGRGDDDLLRLVVEIKGRRGENAKEKANTIRQYWVPAVNNDGGFGRWAVAEFTDVYAMEADFMATLEAAVDDLLALASATEPALA